MRSRICPTRSTRPRSSTSPAFTASSSDNLLANDCDLELIDRVDAALCQYLSATPAGDTINQEVLDATAAVYCEDPTGRPDATTTMPPDPAINAGDER